MTRKDLSKVYLLRRELAMWEARYKEIEAASHVSSVRITGMPSGGGLADATFDRASKELEIKDVIENFKKELEDKIEEIERYIVTLDDPLMRQIIEYRCCRSMTWEQVAAHIGAGTSADSLRIMFSRKFPE